MVRHSSPGTVIGKPMKASDLFVAALENEGIEYIFAVPGVTSSAPLSIQQYFCNLSRAFERNEGPHANLKARVIRRACSLTIFKEIKI